jgi:hypothetical protein
VQSDTAHLQLSIYVDSDPISGSVSNGDAYAQPFTGWIDLVAAIEAARTHGHVTGPGSGVGDGGSKTLGSPPGANGSER